MKTIFQIEKLIELELKPLETEAVTKRGKTTIHNKVEFLTMCKRYIETKPRPEFIESEIERLNKKKDLILEMCDGIRNKKGEPDELRIKKYKAAQGYAELTKQLKTLNFILC